MLCFFSFLRYVSVHSNQCDGGRERERLSCDALMTKKRSNNISTSIRLVYIISSHPSLLVGDHMQSVRCALASGRNTRAENSMQFDFNAHGHGFGCCCCCCLFLALDMHTNYLHWSDRSLWIERPWEFGTASHSDAHEILIDVYFWMENKFWPMEVSLFFPLLFVFFFLADLADHKNAIVWDYWYYDDQVHMSLKFRQPNNDAIGSTRRDERAM